MSRQYKDLSINGKINAKSWGFWRMPNPAGFVMTMIDNANSFKDESGEPRRDYANFMRHHLVADHEAASPKNSMIQKNHVLCVKSN